MKTSVIICAYTEERWTDLLEAVKSMKNQSIALDEIIVVIDHNPHLFERTQAHIKDIIIIENTQQRGLSGARNSGIKIATGDVVAFMDEDAMAEPDWFEHILKAYDDPNVWGVGGTIEPLWEGGRPEWFPIEFNWIVGCTHSGMPNKTAPVRNLVGCNMSFRREVFDAVGGFVHGMGRIGKVPLGCEETELCIRAKQSKPEMTILYEPAAKVLHRVPASRSTWLYFRSRCYAEGLSKAQVTQLVGAGDGLGAERSYTLKTLPLGSLKGLFDAIRGDFNGIRRSVAIIFGLLITTWGYIFGSIKQKFAQTKALSMDSL